MNPTQQRILEHLAALVACDTQNPPRQIGPDHTIFAHLRAVLADIGFDLELIDHGDGRISFVATRGQPSILFNVHLDTVPVGDGWASPPLELTVANGRAYGHGSCDIKGAAAVLLTLAEQHQHDMALLFSTDEEGASGCCVDRFARDPQVALERRPELGSVDTRSGALRASPRGWSRACCR